MLNLDLTQSLQDITDLNQLKSELNEIPAIDVGDYIVEVNSDRRAIAFRLLNKNQATEVFEYLPQYILVGVLICEGK